MIVVAGADVAVYQAGTKGLTTAANFNHLLSHLEKRRASGKDEPGRDKHRAGAKAGQELQTGGRYQQGKSSQKAQDRTHLWQKHK